MHELHHFNKEEFSVNVEVFSLLFLFWICNILQDLHILVGFQTVKISWCCFVDSFLRSIHRGIFPLIKEETKKTNLNNEIIHRKLAI